MNAVRLFKGKTVHKIIKRGWRFVIVTSGGTKGEGAKNKVGLRDATA